MENLFFGSGETLYRLTSSRPPPRLAFFQIAMSLLVLLKFTRTSKDTEGGFCFSVLNWGGGREKSLV